MRDLKQRLFDLLRSGGISVGDNNNAGGNSNSNGNNNGISHPQLLQQQQQQQQMIYSPLQPMPKPKKLHEYTAADCNAAFLRKYHDLSISRDRDRDRDRDAERLDRERERELNNGAANVIYFNENLSMTSKYNVRQFPLTRYPSCPLSSFGISSQRGGEAGGSAGSSLGEEDTESDRYNFCSDEDQSSNAQTLKLRCHKLHLDTAPQAGVADEGDANLVHIDADLDDDDDDVDDDDDEHAESQLDSFCTLCTSTFSYNKCCRFCDNSLCGSKCNSERGSHASRRSCNLNAQFPGVDSELEQYHHQQLQLQQHHQQRFGGSMRLLNASHQQQPKIATSAAIR
ncbi:hypothetical protein KR093_005452 [Drosophila rubida]|uniref:Uncharacterized protein n=1 Tax=Drosophila rubida TaxID=30044 RepID=A0AAD4KA38_9MUSC|nr:hypothetical protein KR093_005452 [Drosophila rubida]